MGDSTISRCVGEAKLVGFDFGINVRLDRWPFVSVQFEKIWLLEHSDGVFNITGTDLAVYRRRQGN